MLWWKTVPGRFPSWGVRQGYRMVIPRETAQPSVPIWILLLLHDGIEKYPSLFFPSLNRAWPEYRFKWITFFHVNKSKWEFLFTYIYIFIYININFKPLFAPWLWDFVQNCWICLVNQVIKNSVKTGKQATGTAQLSTAAPDSQTLPRIKTLLNNLGWREKNKSSPSKKANKMTERIGIKQHWTKKEFLVWT